MKTTAETNNTCQRSCHHLITRLHDLRNVRCGEPCLEQEDASPEFPALQNSVLVLIKLLKYRPQTCNFPLNSIEIHMCIRRKFRSKRNFTSSAADCPPENGKCFFCTGGGRGEGGCPRRFQKRKRYSGTVAARRFQHLSSNK